MALHRIGCGNFPLQNIDCWNSNSVCPDSNPHSSNETSTTVCSWLDKSLADKSAEKDHRHWKSIDTSMLLLKYWGCVLSLCVVCGHWYRHWCVLNCHAWRQEKEETVNYDAVSTIRWILVTSYSSTISVANEWILEEIPKIKGHQMLAQYFPLVLPFNNLEEERIAYKSL